MELLKTYTVLFPPATRGPAPNQFGPSSAYWEVNKTDKAWLLTKTKRNRMKNIGRYFVRGA